MKSLRDPLYQPLAREFRTLRSVEELVDWLNRMKFELGDEATDPLTLQQVTAYAYGKRMRAYKRFEIPKRSGGMRQIDAPNGRLSAIQHCLNTAFQQLYDPTPQAIGFVPGRNVADNAALHVGRKYLLNVDLKDFFPSISEGRVYAVLQLAPLNLAPKVASVVAGLCCRREWVPDAPDSDRGHWHGSLPQGAPTSPILTNYVCRQIDRQLARLARRFGVCYSRYADDMSFSANRACFKPSGQFMTALREIIERNAFTINEAKVRVQEAAYRQEVTGLVVNTKVNVPKRYVRQIRVGLYFWEHYGEERAARLFGDYRGVPCKSLWAVLGGKLQYMRMVKGSDDPTYAKLAARFAALTRRGGGSGAEGDGDPILEMLARLEAAGLDGAMGIDWPQPAVPAPKGGSKGERRGRREGVPFRREAYKVIATFTLPETEAEQHQE